jgi:hypothetical protein
MLPGARGSAFTAPAAPVATLRGSRVVPGETPEDAVGLGARAGGIDRSSPAVLAEGGELDREVDPTAKTFCEAREHVFDNLGG